MDRGAWQAPVHGITKSQTQLSNKHTHTHTQTRLIQEIFKARCSSIHTGCNVNAFGGILYFIHWKHQNQNKQLKTLGAVIFEKPSISDQFSHIFRELLLLHL